MDEQVQSPQGSPRKNTNPAMYVVVAIVVLLVAGGGFYLSRKAMKTSQQTAAPTQAMKDQTQGSMKVNNPATATPSSTTTASPSAANTTDTSVQQVTVIGSNFKFDPATITVKKGQKVQITFKNSGGTHDFVIDALNVATKQIQGGETDTATFTPDKTGTFEYYCSVGQHRAMGMKGTLTVQ